jgi:CRP-like cAMP-binding protein
MLRTNLSFLAFIEDLFSKYEAKGDIILRTYPKGTVMLRQGAQVGEVYIIKEGIAKCFMSEENGKDFIVEFLGEGEIAGEIEVIRNRKCLCNIEALTEVKAYALPVPFFRSLLSQNLDFNQILLAEMAERVANTSSRSSAQQLYSVERGLRKILSFQSRQHIALSKEDMAAYLGITLRTLNRVLSKGDYKG